MSDVLLKTKTGTLNMPSASTSDGTATLATASWASIPVDQKKTVTEDAQSQPTLITKREADNAVTDGSTRGRSFMEIQAPIYREYMDVKYMLDQVMSTQKKGELSQEATATEAHESLAAKKAALEEATEKMSSMMADICDELDKKLRKDLCAVKDESGQSWDQAWAFKTLIDDSVTHLMAVSYDALHPKDKSKRKDNYAAVNKAGASVFEDLGGLHQELSRWKSAEPCEYDPEDRMAVGSARRRLQESIQVFSEQYEHYVEQQTSRGNLMLADHLNTKKVELACQILLSQADKVLQSTSNDGVHGGTSYMRTDQGAESRSEDVTLQAPETDHGSEPYISPA